MDEQPGSAPTLPSVNTPTPGPAPAPADRMFGPYRLTGTLGKGGMGVVYSAVDTRIGRRVAVKTLSADRMSPTLTERFRREVEIASKLKHGNIVTIYEVGVTDGVPYFAMEHLEGEPLSQSLEGGKRLLPRVAAKVARDIARALAFAHDHGVVHRDIKPQNIMIEPSESSDAPALSKPSLADTSLQLSTGQQLKTYRVVLTDFGLARDLATDSRLTQTGEAFGTPLYMSPEQAKGDHEHVDALSDVHSLGAVLYEMLTGWCPFGGETPQEIMAKVVSQEPQAPSQIVKDLSRDLEVICLKAMRKERERRYAGAREMAEDLDRFLSGEAILARPPSRRERLARWVRHRPTAAAVTVAVVVMLLAVVGWAIGRRVMDARDVASLRRGAEDALARGDAEEAGALARRAIEIAPADTTLGALSARARAAACVARSDQYLHSRGELLEEAKRLSEEASSAQAKLEDWDPPSKKFPAWAMEERAVAARAKAEDLLSRAYQELTLAIGFSRDDAGALRRLCDLWMERYEEASTRRDEAAMRDARRWVEQYDREGRCRDRFERKATLAIATEPAGAEAYVFRYEEREHRLVPCPYDCARGECIASPEATIESERVDMRATAYPLAFSSANRLGTTPGRFGLAPGSYLIVLRAPGRVDARYPVLLDIDTPWEGQVRLRTAGEYPKVPSGAWTEDPTEYWCLVPGGAFIAGHDAGADNPYDAPIKPIGDFFLSRYETTMGEWKAFVEDPDLGAIGALAKFSEDKELVNEFPLYRTGTMLGITNASKYRRDTPAMMAGWPLVEAFARWAGARTEAPGRGLVVGLPTEAQWEKAARGVDGRFFPWGNRFDWAFCGGARSLTAPGSTSSEKLAALPAGKFPLDESPYGVRDLAGSRQEWCGVRKAGESSAHPLRGGAYHHSGSTVFRAASRYSGKRDSEAVHIGFRLAAWDE